MTNPFNDNELNFNQNKAQRYKALSIALSAECSMLPNVLNLPTLPYGDNKTERLWEMIKELHTQITNLQYETFTPQQTVELTPVPPLPLIEDEIRF